MTREYEIRKEALKWKADDNEFIAQTAFEAGAKWADEHPKSHWISLKDDLPNQNIQVLLRYKGGGIVIGELSTDLGHVHWLTDDDGMVAEFEWVDYWMPIPELPNGGDPYANTSGE